MSRAERIVLPCAPAPRVSILIVTARQPERLARCLAAIAACETVVPFETIVVLNDALPEVETLVGERVAGVRVVASKVPLGLAGGLNRGRAAARGELLVSLHDDTEPQPGWLDGLIAAVDAHPEAGAVGSTILDLDGGPQSMGSVLWRDGRVWTLGRGPEALVPASETITAVDYCGSSSLLVRAATWDAIGGADERFFPAFYVDVDLCLGVWRRGEAVLCTPGSRVRHHRSASTERPLREFLLARNRVLLLEKWGDELPILEPPPAPDSAAGVRRAVERAQARWRALQQDQARWRAIQQNQARGRAVEQGQAPPFDAAAQERRLLAVALEHERAWARASREELSRALAERDAAAAATGRERARAAAAERELEAAAATLTPLRERDAMLAAIERGRWWRLYQRLLPLLRWARALSRRAGASRTG